MEFLRHVFSARGAGAMLTCAMATSALFAATYTIAEKKAIRREMIEMDVAVRNLTSIVSTSNKKMLADSLERLVAWQMKDHPEHGKAFRSALAKWQASGAIKYGKQVQSEAANLLRYTQERGKFAGDEWAHVKKGFMKILSACQGCHDITRKDQTP